MSLGSIRVSVGLYKKANEKTATKWPFFILISGPQAQGYSALSSYSVARRAKISKAGNVLPSSTSKNAPPPVEM